MTKFIKGAVHLSSKDENIFIRCITIIVYLYKCFRIWLFAFLFNDPLHEEGFDKKHGTNTTNMMDFFEPQYIMNDQTFYQTMPSSKITETFEMLNTDFDDYAFIDVGCGKGKPLLVASDYPFKKIIGIDIAAELINIAHSNINIYKKGELDTSRFELIHKSIEEYTIPEEKLVIHLFNPLNETLMETFLKQIEQSYKNYAREIIFIYVIPVHKEVFMQQDWLEEIPTSTWQIKIFKTGT